MSRLSSINIYHQTNPNKGITKSNQSQQNLFHPPTTDYHPVIPSNAPISSMGKRMFVNSNNQLQNTLTHSTPISKNTIPNNNNNINHTNSQLVDQNHMKYITNNINNKRKLLLLAKHLSLMDKYRERAKSKSDSKKVDKKVHAEADHNEDNTAYNHNHNETKQNEVKPGEIEDKPIPKPSTTRLLSPSPTPSRSQSQTGSGSGSGSGSRSPITPISSISPISPRSPQQVQTPNKHDNGYKSTKTAYFLPASIAIPITNVIMSIKRKLETGEYKLPTVAIVENGEVTNHWCFWLGRETTEKK